MVEISHYIWFLCFVPVHGAGKQYTPLYSISTILI